MVGKAQPQSGMVRGDEAGRVVLDDFHRVVMAVSGRFRLLLMHDAGLGGAGRIAVAELWCWGRAVSRRRARL